MNRKQAFNLVLAVITSSSIFFTLQTNASELSYTVSETAHALNTPDKTNVSVCGVDIASPPYFLFSSAQTPKSGEHRGITYDLMKEVSQQLNINIEILRFPWKRCLTMLKKGTTDGVIGASFIDKRTLFGHYPTTPTGLIDQNRVMFTSVYWLYTNSPSILWNGRSLTLPDNGIAATNLGYSSVGLLEKLGINVHEEHQPSRLVTMLMSNRPVLIAGYENQLKPLISESIKKNKIPAEKIKKRPTPLSHDYMYLLISKPFYRSHKGMTESIWNLFGEFHKSGRYQQIADTYLKK
ncbi:substrate-binding periplasmic protein [Alkalimarinus alittae]|uniref:Transporter substrate-binding domain-containing protein n=1 Tax=Alkalimarinus alittae TaxID=2961619 RepID=A0ABY6N1A8_9ALTE|nr:transporter substrate-binding domain-containing protein [Alkalimarinus alittae]UZE95893.1 transporter substrate-binding domain-containing protein [Alkalimarinus alittae]